MTSLDYTIIVLFLAAMALGGLWISRLIKTSDDFFVAGRELTPFILAATITATNVSMFHFVSMGGVVTQKGVSIIWQNWTGNMAMVLAGIFVLPIMCRLKIRSVPEFLEMRYTRGLRTIVGAFWGLRLTVYLGILLYLAATAAAVITGWKNYAAWLAVFSLIAILYSVIGGAWAVAIMDSFQFVVMLAGALVVFPIAMHAAGGLPAMLEHFRAVKPAHVDLVPQNGEFNWLFILAIMMLGFKFTTIDQALLQRAFGAKNPRTGAKGMVFSALITTPMSFLWILPGLAVARLHPEPFGNPDEAIPWLLKSQLPQVAVGLLGFVLCGLVAAQVSTITADVNSVATLLTSDVYRTLKRREPTQQQLLRVVRWSSLFCGVGMLAVAWALQFINAGAVRANLVMVGILDMPLFIVAIFYGLLWKRMNWQGAVAGFLCGGVAGVMTYLMIDPQFFNPYLMPIAPNAMLRWHEAIAHLKPNLLSIAPLVSSVTALIFTPIVSLITPHRPRAETEQIWAAVRADHADDGGNTFHLVPRSTIGKAAAMVVLIGFVCFFAGVLSASQAYPNAAMFAVIGMLAIFAGGAVRVVVD